GAQVTAAGSAAQTLSIVAVDLDAYRRIVADRPVHTPPEPRAGGAAPPALFSPALANLAKARGLTLAWARGTLPGRWAGTIGDFPTLPSGIGFVVIPYRALDLANAQPTTIFVRGDQLDPGRLRRAAIADAHVDSGISVDTYAAVHGGLTGTP